MSRFARDCLDPTRCTLCLLLMWLSEPVPSHRLSGGSGTVSMAWWLRGSPTSGEKKNRERSTTGEEGHAERALQGSGNCFW